MTLRALLSLILAGTCLLGLPAAGDQHDHKPQDYTALEGLSAPIHQVSTSSTRVPMRDGAELALTITRPVGDGPWPTILVLSPYLGVYGENVETGFLGPDAAGEPLNLDDHFPPRGYVVIEAAIRGTGGSSGCLQLLGPTDRADAVELIEWIAAQPWSDGTVGMAGHSYPALAAVAAAAEAPPALRTIVSSAGGGTMYEHQFHGGVPYVDLILGPLATYQSFATVDRVASATDTDPTETGCEWSSSTALHTDHASGVETDWHRDRDVRAAVANAAIPVFASYGTDDSAVDLQALDWFTGRGGNAHDKLWIGQWGHGHVSVGGESYPYPNDREEQWRGAVHAWFDHHLQGRDVETGPPVEVFLNDQQVLAEGAWPPPTTPLTLYPGDVSFSSGALSEAPGTAEVVDLHAAYYHPLEPTALTFEGQALDEPVLLVGSPRLRLRAAIDGPRANLVAKLEDVAPDGRATPLHVRGFALNPELRDGLDTVRPVVAGEVMDLDMPGVGVAHRLEAGHRLRLVVTTTGSGHEAASAYLPTFGQASTVSVHLGGVGGSALDVPVVDAPNLWPDPRLP